jgi:predicted nuclease of predicted toxin-antitoxin system
VRFVADESIDRQIVEVIRRNGNKVFSVAESSPGIPDTEVLNRANEDRAILLTADKDFGDLVFRQHWVHPGVVLVRLAGYAPNVKAEIVAAAIKAHGHELAYGFSVITGRAVRIRRVQP